MLGSKHSFWEALIVALIIFWTGILLGVFFEQSRINDIEEFYFDSETDVFDFQVASGLIFSENLDCETISEMKLIFADQIFEEARRLEKYDNSNRLTKELIALHRRYDLLRAMLWEGIIQNSKRCEDDIETVVYLYDYVDTPFDQKAQQGAYGNHLTQLKKDYGDSIVLIPIAVDTEVQSLDILRDRYNLDKIPVVIVNEKEKFESLDSLKNIDKAFKLNNNSFGINNGNVIKLN
jgi:hypothetical protein